jgi:hypothetical protein
MDADAAARYARQILLVEIGRLGQERIAAARAAVAPNAEHAALCNPIGDSVAHWIAERYALRAGFAGVEPGVVDVGALAPADLVEHREAREVLAGARAAVRAILKVTDGT